jgi:hypothetical protein
MQRALYTAVDVQLKPGGGEGSTGGLCLAWTKGINAMHRKPFPMAVCPRASTILGGNGSRNAIAGRGHAVVVRRSTTSLGARPLTERADGDFCSVGDGAVRCCKYCNSSERLRPVAQCSWGQRGPEVDRGLKDERRPRPQVGRSCMASQAVVAATPWK